MLFSGDDDEFQEIEPLATPDLEIETEAKDAILVDTAGTKEARDS
jgi:hypothetical protein